jgi:hypothetical protein
MSKGVARKHTDEQVRLALTVLVANQGNAQDAVRQINDEGLNGEVVAPISPQMLQSWRDDLYSEVYLDIERTHGQSVEDEIVNRSRDIARRAAEIELEMMERIRTETQPRELPVALRAVADLKSKSVDTVMKLTGRDKQEAATGSLESLVASMEGKGYLHLNVSLGEPPKKADVDGEAIEE